MSKKDSGFDTMMSLIVKGGIYDSSSNYWIV